MSGAPSAGRRAIPHLRIQLSYLWRHRRIARVAEPRLFTEWVQHRKLYDRDARLPALADKLAAKAHVADLLGPEWVVPTLWSGTLLPPRPIWPGPFVVKSRHGSNQVRFWRTGREDWRSIRRAAQLWMRAPYGAWLDEWGYAGVERGVLVERFIGVGTALPVDYKLYVFGGRVGYVQVHLGRGDRHRWVLFDPLWNRVSKPSADRPDAPRSLSRMIAAAETLADGFDFVRVDFYEVAGRPMFGEMTFYPGSGLDPFAPVALDAVMGARWAEARRRP